MRGSYSAAAVLGSTSKQPASRDLFFLQQSPPKKSFPEAERQSRSSACSSRLRSRVSWAKSRDALLPNTPAKNACRSAQFLGLGSGGEAGVGPLGTVLASLPPRGQHSFFVFLFFLKATTPRGSSGAWNPGVNPTGRCRTYLSDLKGRGRRASARSGDAPLPLAS